MASWSMVGLSLAVMLISVLLSGCLSEARDTEDEEALSEPFTRIRGVGMTSSQSYGCDLVTGLLNGPCLEFDLQVLAGITCDPPQIFLEVMRGDLSNLDRAKRTIELPVETQITPGDSYLSCRYKVPWSATANFVYPGSSLEVAAQHNQGKETRICEAGPTESCTVHGVMEGNFLIEGPDDSKQLRFMLEGAVDHDLKPVSAGDIDLDTKLTLRT